MVAPKHAADLRPSLLAKPAGADTFQGIDQTRERQVRRIGEKDVDMVPIRIDSINMCAHVSGDRGQNLLHEVPDAIRRDRAPTILRRQDQMGMKAMDDMSSCSEIVHFSLSKKVETYYIFTMLRRKAYRVRIYPTPAQEAAFRQIAGCCRMIYNLGLEQRRSFWRAHRAQTGRSISWMGQKRELPALKEAAPFLKVVPAHCLQMALVDLDTAFARFFAGTGGYPQPRRKFRNDSFTFPDPDQIRIEAGSGRLVLPKFGKTKRDHGAIRAVFHRPLRGRVKRVTIAREGTQWYAAISVAIRVRRAEKAEGFTADDVIGIDRGVAIPVATSSGDLLGMPVSTERDRRKASRLQRNLARTQRGSRRRQKALARLRAHQARIARRRRDTCHKITSHLAKNHRVIVIEDLRVQAMTASARGSVEAPGRRVAQKAGLNRAILDVGWGEIRRQLGYKLAWRGGILVEVPARDTSRTCSRCHTVDAVSRVTRSLFRCTSCGHEDHADINASKEIRLRGLEALGLGPRPERSGQSAESSARGMALKRKEKNEGMRPRGAPSSHEVMA